jgi:hypothetical protein
MINLYFHQNTTTFLFYKKTGDNFRRHLFT